MSGIMPIEWRCIVLNESLYEDIIYRADFMPGQAPTTIRDLENRPLQFTSVNRPRRRNLYMTLLISYLWAKRHLVAGLDQKVESKRFWPSAGTYLERSTLQTLARCISGCQIPENLTAEHTFEHPTNPERNVPGMAMAADLLDMRKETPESVGPEVMDTLTESMRV
ncbi:unnamed protein product [Penicillium salamii]|uniref:Uncharacterized protein n=1 Tax=Penicillium salamii TaxID=1612424 RepID=A0A9W4JA45_9EURO|nr:unnamed protein product [Penicillium salamii]